MSMIDETHDPSARSWVEAANRPGADFPLQNLPFGIWRRRGSGGPGRIGVAIGDAILDLAACADTGAISALRKPVVSACRAETLNPLLALGRDAGDEVRRAAFRLLRDDAAEAGGALLVPMANAELLLPARVGDYTDFYASIEHASHVGALFRPDAPLLPNYRWVPIGYHGRASSLVPSGTPVRRPQGQRKGQDEEVPTFGPSRSLDYECELGCFIGAGNVLGEPIDVERAGEHAWGYSLVNDWSARDVQAWEYQPLGPFLGKSFATTVGPWVVTAAAVEPFRAPRRPRGADEPAALAHLDDPGDAAAGALDIVVEVRLRTERMREAGAEPEVVSRGNTRGLYWTFAQMIAHHTSNGCNLVPGDLLASGTVSGGEPESVGCLLERTRRGAEPITLSNGERRGFLEDGDEVILSARCEREGFVPIGFGECRGVVVPAVGVG